MRIYTGLRHRGRGIAALLLCLYLPACAGGWKTTNVAPAQYITEKKPESVRVTTDSLKTVIIRPQVTADSLKGIVSTPTGLGITREDSTGVALADIRRLEVPAKGVSTLAMVVIGAVFLAGLIALASSNWMHIDLGGGS
jgi:hypothetical protein